MNVQDEASPVSLVSQEHSLQLVENLRRIYDEEDCFLHDITLCSKDSGEVKAHKIILAAQSEYFKVIVAFSLKSLLSIVCRECSVMRRRTGLR